MKYEVTIDGETKLIDISRVEGGYLVSLNDGKVQKIDVEHLSSDLMSMLIDGRSVDVGYSPNSDGFEVEFKGARYLTEVVDPRKKSLNMAKGAGANKVVTRMPGRVIDVCVTAGQAVQKGDVVVIIEAMKMENPLKSPIDGFIDSIEVQPGDVVQVKQVLLTLRGD